LSQPSPRSPRAALALAAVLVAALVAGPATVARPGASAVAAKDPRLTQRLYVPSWPAQRVDRDPRYRRIWSQPQAVWLTDSYPGRAQVRRVVQQTVREARAQRRTPVLVVYAITNRDCGSYSAGGYGPREYRAFVDEVARGLRGSRPMVVLEPDALANLGACDTSATTSLMRYATKRLGRAGAWVYLDAGHSTWMPAPAMAKRLKAAGVRHARGFSTNVSNFNRSARERRFGDAVLRELARRGVKGRRYVVDTSRNGGRHRVSDGWCNPSTARLGSRPRVVNRTNARGALDAYLWIKSPGESDGSCRPGQPAAGQWWPAGARRLLR
jgi:endoglucanase